MNEKTCLDRIKLIGEELKTKRNVSVESFLIDGIALLLSIVYLFFLKLDGWDDQDSLWDFNKNFPNEFQELHKAAAKYLEIFSFYTSFLNFFFFEIL
jgi:hypothetical protein